jgi:sarcosine oxidase subunit gamma
MSDTAAAAARPVRLSRAEDPGMIALRLDLSDADAVSAAAAALGPAAPGIRRLTASGPRRLWWMSPDEWLLMLPRAEVPAALEAVETALSGRHHLAADLSDARAVFRLQGAGAREVLAKGAPADLSRAAFRAGDVRRTRLGQLPAAFALLSEEPEVFELICFRSVAGHVETWLETAAAPGSLPGVL